MRVWLAHVGEPLPIDAVNERQLRMSLFAQHLAARGHDVTWWTSTFDHTHKRQRFEEHTDVRVSERLTLRLLYARPYSSNISINRLINHRQAANAFAELAEAHPAHERPDFIFATLPTLEMAAAAATFGKKHGIPVVIDVRDLHPDIYLTLVPVWARPLARIALSPLYRDLRTAVTKATSIVAIAPSFLKWALDHAGREARDTDAVFPLAYPEIEASADALARAAEKLAGQGVNAAQRIVWYVGTFNRWIDLETPIKAARMLAEAGRDDIQFVISGSGGFDARLRRMAEGLPNVVFTGWVDVPEIIHMREISWVGLAPYQPGFHTVGNKLFEYMAGGLPVLISIGGDARDIVERNDAGMGYEGGNPESLVDVIGRMAENGVQQRMSESSLRAFRDHYSASKVYGEMDSFVTSLARRDAQD